jgi:hypothetical protein
MTPTYSVPKGHEDQVLDVLARTEALGATLGVLGGGPGGREAPQEDEPCEGFDEGVGPEADEGYRLGHQPGSPGDGSLNAVPAHSELGELLGPLDKALPLGVLLRLGAELYRLGAHVPTPAVSVLPTTAVSSEVPASVREYMTVFPSLLERTRPRERRAPR